jgi:methylglutaconyl-CoA hydratase
VFKIIVGRIHGKAVGGGVGIAACDYALRIESAKTFGTCDWDWSIEIPAVSRKIGKTAMTEMTGSYRMENTDLGSRQRAKVVENQVELDIDIAHFTAKLASTIRSLNSNEKII